MTWCTDSINDILEQYEKDPNIKPLVRDITINHILSDDKDEIVFPFLIHPVTGKLDLRAPNLSFNYTEEEKNNILEISDPTTIFKYVKLTNNGSYSDWNPYPFQLDWITNYSKYKFNFFITSRQIGSSNLEMLSVLHYILINKDKTIFYIGPSNQNCTETAIKLYNLFNSLPFYMRVGVTKREINDIHFENGCVIRFYSHDKLIPSSVNINLLIIDDLSRMRPDILKDLFPQCERCLISTLPSKDKLTKVQYNTFGVGVFNIIKYNWECVPTRDENWAKNEILQIGGALDFINEYSCGEANDRLKAIVRDYKIESIL